MSHSHIYTPYTYLVGWSKLRVFYYGSRYSKRAHPSDLWVTYFTSSKYVAKFRQEHGEPDIIEVRKTFNDPKLALTWELRVLRRMGVVKRNDFLNKTDRHGIRSVGAPLSENHRRNISKGLQGKVKISADQRTKIAESNATRQVTDKVRVAMANTAKLEVTRNAVAMSNRKRIISDETRAKLSAATARRNSDPIFIAQREAGKKKKRNQK